MTNPPGDGGRRKLDHQAAASIKSALSQDSSHARVVGLSVEFQVTPETIRSIRRGQTWGDVEPILTSQRTPPAVVTARRELLRKIQALEAEPRLPSEGAAKLARMRRLYEETEGD
ncbi:hypothetical protein ABZ470_31765 [Streptosporangium sp. NPDC020072]|uniref:hypothetical protein n=1 Tax=Streptosporangium sp. NPDC020072 TaxID=3154788 RepID=UPI00343B1879